MKRMTRLMSRIRSRGVQEAAIGVFGYRLLPMIPRGDRWDRLYATLLFRLRYGRFPEIGRRSFSDYLHGLKVTGALEEPLRVFVTDKELAKLFISATIGSEHVIPTIAILRDQRDLSGYRFPDRCVIKSTHGCGQAILRHNGEDIDKSIILNWLSYSHYRHTAERNYRSLTPKIIVEPFAFDGSDFLELKIQCYRARPRFISVTKDRFTGMRFRIVDCSWQDPGFSYVRPPMGARIPRPENLDRILELATRLSSHFESIRVDLYTNGDRILIGELTNCPHNALVDFFPPESEAIFSAAYFS
jgi:hypothetical protein